MQPMRKLDEAGRCCGRKPLVYKREPHYFCDRCDRAFSLRDGVQIANWAWRAVDGGFTSAKTVRGETSDASTD